MGFGFTWSVPSKGDKIAWRGKGPGHTAAFQGIAQSRHFFNKNIEARVAELTGHVSKLLAIMACLCGSVVTASAGTVEGPANCAGGLLYCGKQMARTTCGSGRSSA